MTNNYLQTPYFLIKQGLLEQNIAGFRNALDELWPNSLIAYSVKTNSLPWILQWMDRHNVYAEVVSDEEYQLAELSGYSTGHIVFNGPIKSDKYLRKAIDGKSIINIDSEHELKYLEDNKPLISGLIGVRINVNPSIFNPDDVGYQEDGFRFGFSDENGELGKAIARIKAIYGNIPLGLHMHVNSVTRALEVYQAIAKFACKIINKYSLHPAYVDMGGGFFGGVPGKTTPDEYIKAIKDELTKSVDVSNTILIIEPGSAAIGSSIELHTSVLDIKDTAHSRIVTTDGSRIHIDPLWLKNRYMFTTDAKKPAYERQIICGYTCMDHDRLMVIDNIPELSVGDKIVYHRVGNYTVTFGGPFIKPYPSVYVEMETGVEMVRRQMTVEEYYRMETT